jgi:hypothetical protein
MSLSGPQPRSINKTLIFDRRRWPRPYGVGARLHGLPAGLSGRTLLAGVCLAGERLRLTA